MGAGGFISKSYYNHDLPVQNLASSWENFGRLYFLSVTKNIYNNWYFSNEFGFQNSNLLHNVEFQYQFNDSDIKTKILRRWINNKELILELWDSID